MIIKITTIAALSMLIGFPAFSATDDIRIRLDKFNQEDEKAIERGYSDGAEVACMLGLIEEIKTTGNPKLWIVTFEGSEGFHMDSVSKTDQKRFICESGSLYLTDKNGRKLVKTFSSIW